MITSTIENLNIIACLSIFGLGLSLFIRKRVEPIRVLFGLILFILSISYFARNFSEKTAESLPYQIEHLLNCCVPFLSAIFIEMILKFRPCIKFKLSLSITCFALIITGLIPGFHVTNYWVVPYFIYQFATFAYLINLARRKKIEATDIFDIRISNSVMIILISTVLIILADWGISQYYFDRRPSALLVFPILYLVTILINNPVYASFRKEMLKVLGTIAKSILFAGVFHYFWELQSKLSLYIYFVTYLIIELAIQAMKVNIVKLLNVNLNNLVYDLVTYKNSESINAPITGVERIAKVSSSELQEHGLEDVILYLEEAAEPISSFDINRERILSEKASLSEYSSQMTHFFDLYDCHIAYINKANDIITIKMINPDDTNGTNVTIGKLAALLAA